ncbi:MAG: hypothetical protein IPL76_10785 [Gemmatimonadetes bacterium]|nr:hypothetical protein [Gemmatimonadota bacterium]
MSEITLKHPETFGQALVDIYLKQGFQSLSKRDMDLLIFLLLELDGAVDRESTNYEVARRLRLTPARVKTLRQDAYARWRPLVPTDRKATLQRILREALTTEKIKSGSKYASEKTRDHGFLAIRIEHADDRQEFEQAVLDSGGLPIYERNPDVLVLSFDTLLAVAKGSGSHRRVRRTSCGKSGSGTQGRNIGEVHDEGT